MSFPPPRLAPTKATAQRFSITSRSTNVRVVATSGATPHVEGATMHRQPDGSFAIEPSRPRGNELLLVCSTDSDLTIGTASGRVELAGSFGNVKVVTASGRTEVEHAAAIDVRSSSAAVRVGHCDGDCRVATTSGGVHIERTNQADVSSVSGKVKIDDVDQAVIRTVSGTVSLGSQQGGRARVRTVSGSVDIVVPAAAKPAAALRSVSGKIRCECATGSDGNLDVKTVSGPIRVSIR